MAKRKRSKGVAGTCKVITYRKGPMKGKRRRICWNAKGKIKSNTRA